MKDDISEVVGNIERVVYDSPDYKVVSFGINRERYPEIKVNEKYGTLSVTGCFPDLDFRDRSIDYALTIRETFTKKYGVGYELVNIKRDAPRTVGGVRVFLSEILTPRQAEALVSSYPDIIERVRDNRTDDIDLKKIKGIGKKRFERVKEKIFENFCLADIVEKFGGRVSMTVIKKLYNKYGSVIMIERKLSEDPYNCFCSLGGVGFLTADKIILDMDEEGLLGFDGDIRTSKERCLACVEYHLKKNEEDGNTRMDISALRNLVAEDVPESAEKFIEAISDDKIYTDISEGKISLKAAYTIEKRITDIVRDGVTLHRQYKLSDDIEKYRMIGNIGLSDEQMRAIKNFIDYGVSILNGAAGTGKSFATQAIISLLEDNRLSFKLMSPTGKAAQILKKYTGKDTYTIHRGLGYNPGFDDPWTYNRNNKLDVDAVIVDEFSMVDIYLFSHLADAIDFDRTRLLLIGDNAQLCSVGAGNLLHDMIQSGIIPQTTLTKVFRYADGGLMKVATDVRFGKVYLSWDMKDNTTVFGSKKDYIFIDTDPDNCFYSVINVYKSLIAKGVPLTDVQVLVAQNKGECGVVNLNNALQKIANPNSNADGIGGLKYGDTVFFPGDIVIQLVNNYKAHVIDDEEEIDHFVANGESGEVISADKDGLIIRFDGKDMIYKKDKLSSIALGYAITIHKSQGSGFRFVILCTPKQHTFMLNSNLIYVGMTRTQERCIHIGQVYTVGNAIQRRMNLERDTFSQKMLKNA